MQSLTLAYSGHKSLESFDFIRSTNVEGMYQGTIGFRVLIELAFLLTRFLRCLIYGAKKTELVICIIFRLIGSFFWPVLTNGNLDSL